jgi:class 3 adenylate cyclase/tetratricopeptide (TPR) repeat protein
MSHLSIYLPTDRRIAIANGASLLDRVRGAALFADISGFTPLTEMLTTELGPQRGAEELTRHLNTVFDTLISELNRFGGSVVGFSGDAITCWFDEDSGIRAAASALAMQRQMVQFKTIASPSGVEAGLAMKAAIAVGSARRFLVGDPKIQVLDVLAGRLLDELAAAEGLAERGEVVLASSASSILESSMGEFTWRNSSGDQPVAVISELKVDVPEAPLQLSVPLVFPEERIRSWLPDVIYERIKNGRGEFLAELRPAVALFLRFSGIDYEKDDQAGEKLDSFIRIVQARLKRYEATMLDLTIGDKGSYLYASFGAPVAHEDDPQRAVAAALELHGVVDSFPFIDPIQIGISQGMMRAGTYGGTTRGTYGVHGNDVNIAARLMVKAVPGQILVTQRISNAVETTFDVREIGSLDLKGQDHPVPVFAATGIRKVRPIAQAVLPTMVGRSAERNSLAEALRILGDGKGSKILIEGEAGIGKSRLVAELLEKARASGFGVLLGAGDAIENATPYRAWRSVFSTYFEIENTENIDIVHKRILESLSGDWQDRAPLLRAVLPIQLADTELTAQMTTDMRSENTRELLLQLLDQRAQQSPFVLVLEDAHWLDSASWALLEQVLSRIPGILTVVVSRPVVETHSDEDPPPSTQVPDEYLRIGDDPSILLITLDTLPLNKIPELIQLRLNVSNLPSVVSDLIVQHGEGHPLFSEEIALALLDREIITIENGHVRLNVDASELAKIDLPDTLHGVISNRLDLLPSDQLLTLKVASVVGRTFPFQIVHDIHPIAEDRPNLRNHFENLDRLEITPLESPEPDLTYNFRHSITQEVIYQHMLFSQRTKLHQAVAGWYEKNHADDLSPYFGLLAHHMRQAAGDEVEDPILVFKALGYFEKAGDQALQQSAYRESVSYFDQALSFDERFTLRHKRNDFVEIPLAQDSQRQARWMRKVGEAYRGWGHFSKGQDYFERASALYGQPMPKAFLRLGASILSQMATQLGHRLWPTRLISRAKESARPRILEVARIYLRLGEMYFFADKKIHSLFTIIRTLNLSETAGSSSELAEAEAAMSLTMGLFGFHSQADVYYERALETAQRTDEQAILADVLRVNGLYRIGIGQCGKAYVDLNQSHEISERLGDRRHVGDCLTLLSHLDFIEGNYARATETSAELIKMGERDENPILQIWGLYQKSVNSLKLGLIDDAIAAAKTSLELIDLYAEGAAKIFCLGALAKAYWRQGSIVEAKEAADKAAHLIAQSRGLPSAYNVLEGYVAAAEVNLGQWERSIENLVEPSISKADELQHAARKSTRALHIFRRLFPIGGPSAWLYQGLYDWLLRKPKQAHKAWLKSLKLADRMTMPYEEGRARYEIGRHLPEGHPAREEHLLGALTIFEELTTPHEIKMVKGALENE